jgi:vacuolar-type H+-ATPase subunit E/Vma4
VGFDDLLRVLRQEAANEERGLREEAAREAEGIVAEARAEASRLLEAGLARERKAAEARLTAARDEADRERDRAVLAESRRQLEQLRAEAVVRLTEAIGEADVARMAAELLEEAGPVEALLVVDPGSGPAAQRALSALGCQPVPTVREAEVARGGVELVTGCLVLDDTVRSRLERAWPRLEPELARILFAGPAEGE